MPKINSTMLYKLKDLIQSKVDAKQAIKDIANAKRDDINNNPNLTDAQKAKALKKSMILKIKH